MKISKEILYLSFFLIFLPLFSVATIVYGSNIEHQRWSFDFKDCTVLDALRQITNITNIEIVTNRNGDKEIPSKSYKDQTIDQILRDLFRKESCAMIWRYEDSDIASIDIWVFKGGGSGGSVRQERFAKQGGAKLQGNRVKKTTDFKSKISMKKSPKIERNDSFSPQKKSKAYVKTSEDFIDARYSKLPTVGGHAKADNLSSTISDTKKSPGIQLTAGTPPPTPEKRHGLEPPPMPPGFSN